jgi:hypothetical protein
MDTHHWNQNSPYFTIVALQPWNEDALKNQDLYNSFCMIPCNWGWCPEYSKCCTVHKGYRQSNDSPYFAIVDLQPLKWDLHNQNLYCSLFCTIPTEAGRCPEYSIEGAALYTKAIDIYSYNDSPYFAIVDLQPLKWGHLHNQDLCCSPFRTIPIEAGVRNRGLYCTQRL